jgi:hypothetical protein
MYWLQGLGFMCWGAPQFCILVLDLAERPSVPSCEDPSTLLLLLPRVMEQH